MEEIVEEFFERSFENVVTEAMFERDYVFPRTKVEDYIMSIVSTPYQQFVDYICTHYNPNPIENSEIPQISNYEACTTDVCQVLKFRDNPGMDCLEIGKALFTDDVERKEGAYFKFGENQVKGASFHGLTHCYYKKWFLTCLGYLYPELDEELRQYLAARTLLRNPLFHLVISEAKEKDVNIKKYMSGLSPSTQIRRSSSCMHFFDVILRQCQLEGVSLHSIIFDKNDVSLTSNSNESKSDDNTSLPDRQRNKSKNIYVLLPNGNRIMRKNAIDTFVATLQYIGLERVATFKDRLFCGYPLVGKEERGGDYKWQKEVDGWYVYTYMSNDTKIEILKALSDSFSLGLTAKYEDGQDEVIKEKQMESPKSQIDELSISRLCTIFFDVSTAERFFWFISILQICLKNKSNKIRVRQIFVRMIANAWYPIIRRNLTFGYTDPLGKLTKDLHNKLQIPLDLTVDDIVDFINKRINDDVVQKSLWKMSSNIPSDFLKPWIDKLFSYEIEKESQKQGVESPYSIFNDYVDGTYIIFDKNWKAYLKDNYALLLDFTYRSLAIYLKTKNKQVFDLVTLLKTNNDTTTANLEVVPTSSGKLTSFYYLNTNKQSYIFNSQYDQVYSCLGKIIKFNNKYYRVIISEESFVVREVKLLTNKQAVLSNSIINAHWNSPLFAIFETKLNIELIEDIRLNSADGQHDIKVSGEWYNNKGNLLKQEFNNKDVFPKELAESAPIIEEQKTKDTKDSDASSSIIGRYIRMFPSQDVGKVIRVKATSLGQRKLIVETTEGKLKEIYDDPYLYEILSPSKVQKILKM
jgi:hypothetical protein